MRGLEQAAQAALVVQAVLVFVSLGFIWIQLRQNAEIAKAANAQSLVQHAMTFTSTLLQDPDLARLWCNHGVSLADESSVDRYREMLVQWLIFHENIFHQHKKRLLDESIYKSWREDLKYTVKHHKLEVISKNIEAFFPEGFGHHLVALRQEAQDPDFAWELPAQKKKFLVDYREEKPDNRQSSSGERRNKPGA